MINRNAEQEAREIVSLYVHNHGRHREPLSCPSCRKLCSIIAAALQRRDDRIKQTEIQNERLRRREGEKG